MLVKVCLWANKKKQEKKFIWFIIKTFLREKNIFVNY